MKHRDIHNLPAEYSLSASTMQSPRRLLTFRRNVGKYLETTWRHIPEESIFTFTGVRISNPGYIPLFTHHTMSLRYNFGTINPDGTQKQMNT
jgi:hypothetical protein